MKSVLLIVLCLLTVSANAQHEKVATKNFWFVNAASVGFAALDVANTQRCIRANTCHEANPIMVGSATKQYTIAVGGSIVASYVSYRMKKAHYKYWWIIPAANAVDHGVEFGLSFRY